VLGGPMMLADLSARITARQLRCILIASWVACGLVTISQSVCTRLYVFVRLDS
jgi:hypothetical protein